MHEGYGQKQAVAIAFSLARKKKNPVHFRNDPLVLRKWFERDRAWVALVNDNTNEVVVEFWDDELREAVEDGILDPKNYHKSLMKYAQEHKLIWDEDRPESRKNPYSENEIPDRALRLIAKAAKQVVREYLRIDPDSIIIEGYYKTGLSRNIPIAIYFPIKGLGLWSDLKVEIFKRIKTLLVESGVGLTIDDPEVLKGQPRISLMRADPSTGTLLLEFWPGEIEKFYD